jgi:hypothetical protein
MREFFFRVWLGPNWESFLFSNIGEGDVFRPTSAWTQVADDRGRLTIDIDMMDNLSAYTWRMTLAGYNIDEPSMTPDRLILIESSTDMQDWRVYCYGIIDSVNASSDHTAANDWNVRAVSVSERLQRKELSPVRIGDLDIAKSASAFASSSLGARWKETPNNLDASGPQNSFTPEHVVDGDKETLWICDNWVGDSEDRSTMELLSMVGPALSPDVYEGTRFVEIVKIPSPQDFHLLTYDIANGAWRICGPHGQEDLGRLAEDGDSLLLVENQTVFDRYYGGSNQFDTKVDLSEDKDKPRRDFMGYMRADKGVVALRHTSIGGYRRCADHIAWGNWTEAEWRELDNNFPDSGDFCSWSTANIVRSPNYYEVIRKTGTGWTVDTLQHPGTEIQTYEGDDAGFYDYSREAWIVLELPPMGHVLGRDVSAGDAVVYVEDGEGYPWVEGLPSAGRIFMDDEILSYSSRNFDTGVLTLSSPATKDHNSGTDIKVESEVTPGKFLSGWPLGSTGWENKQEPTPRDFIFRWAEHEQGMNPDNPYHRYTYNLSFQTLGYTGASWAIGHDPVMRARKICLEVGRMTKGGTASVQRPRIGTLTAKVRRDYFDTDRWFVEMSNEKFVQNIILVAGNNLNVDSYGTGLTRREGVTDMASAWMVITDAAQYGNSFVEVNLDNRFLVKPNHILSGSWNHSMTLDMTSIQSLVVEQVRDYELGQMELTWESPDGSIGGEQRYPATKGRGSVRRQGPQLFANETQAQVAVQRLYQINKYPHRIFVDLVDARDDIRPGDIHRIIWDYRGDVRTLLALAESVEISVSNQTISVNVQYQELQRS